MCIRDRLISVKTVDPRGREVKIILCAVVPKIEGEAAEQTLARTRAKLPQGEVVALVHPQLHPSETGWMLVGDMEVCVPRWRNMHPLPRRAGCWPVAWLLQDMQPH